MQHKYSMPPHRVPASSAFVAYILLCIQPRSSASQLLCTHLTLSVCCSSALHLTGDHPSPHAHTRSPIPQRSALSNTPQLQNPAAHSPGAKDTPQLCKPSSRHPLPQCQEHTTAAQPLHPSPPAPRTGHSSANPAAHFPNAKNTPQLRSKLTIRRQTTGLR